MIYYKLDFTCETDAREVIEAELPNNVYFNECDSDSFYTSLEKGLDEIVKSLVALKSKYPFMKSYQVEDYDLDGESFTIRGSFECDKLPEDLQRFKIDVIAAIENTSFEVATVYWTLLSQATYWEPAEYEDHEVSGEAGFYNIHNLVITKHED